jgi:hypothetical protein
MLLHYFSDQPDLDVLEPRIPSRHPEREPFVYAVEAKHTPLYLFPRDCPRLAVWADEGARSEDIEWLRQRTARRVLLAVDASWADRVATGTVYRYDVPADTFFAIHDSLALVSRVPVCPVGVTVIDNLPKAIMDADAMLAVVGNLSDFARSIEESTLNAAMIRMGQLTPARDGASLA